MGEGPALNSPRASSPSTAGEWPRLRRMPRLITASWHGPWAGRRCPPDGASDSRPPRPTTKPRSDPGLRPAGRVFGGRCGPASCQELPGGTGYHRGDPESPTPDRPRFRCREETTATIPCPWPTWPTWPGSLRSIAPSCWHAPPAYRPGAGGPDRCGGPIARGVRRGPTAVAPAPLLGDVPLRLALPDRPGLPHRGLAAETREGRDPRRELPWPDRSSAQFGLSLVGTGTSPSAAMARGETCKSGSGRPSTSSHRPTARSSGCATSTGCPTATWPPCWAPRKTRPCGADVRALRRIKELLATT